MDFPVTILRPNCPAIFAPQVSPPAAIDTFAGNLVGGAVATNDVSLTVAANANRALVALIGNDNTLTVSGVTYTAGSGGVWVKLGNVVAATNRELEIWGSIAPAAGAVTIRTTFSANIVSDSVVALYSAYNVNQTAPIDTYTSDAVGNTPTISLALTAADLMLGMIVGNGTFTPVLSGTQDYDNANNAFWNAAHKAGAGSTTITWTGAANARGINACRLVGA